MRYGYKEFWSEYLKGIDYSDDLGVDGEDNIRKDFMETGWDIVDWIHLARDEDQLRAVVNTVMNSRVP